MPHPHCVECRRWFPTQVALDQHLTFSRQHPYRCLPCARDFVRQEARLAHWEHSAVHVHTYCSPCQENYNTPESLILHYKTAAAHKYTYDAQCDILFEDSQKMVSHQLNTPAKHHPCVPCHLDYGTNQELQDHFNTAEVHRESCCSTCGIGFGDVSSFGLVCLAVEIPLNPC